MNLNSLDLAKNIALGALDKKATRLVVQDLKGVSDLCEYQIICSAENDRQTKAIAQAIEERCAQVMGIKPLAAEGKQSGHWILLDYGSILVHIFFSQVRDYYALDTLWPKAKIVDLKLG